MIFGKIASRFPKELTRTLTIQKRLISTNFIKFSSSEVASKSAYEAEVEKFKIKDHKFHESHGFVNNSPLEDAMFHKAYYFIWCTIIIGVGFPILFYGPDWSSSLKYWKRREALIQLEARLAAGKLPVDPDFAPASIIGDMVPAPGKWEDEWLAEQPAVTSHWVPDLRKVVDKAIPS